MGFRGGGAAPGGGTGTVDTIVEGDDVTVDATDPANPIVGVTPGAFDPAGSAAAAQAAAEAASDTLGSAAAAFAAALAASDPAGSAAAAQAAAEAASDPAGSAAAAQAASQPVDDDLTAIAALADAQGDVLVRGAAGWERLPKSATATDVLTAGATQPEWAAAPAGGGPTVKIKTANTVKANTTTLANDPHLAGVAVLAATFYTFRCDLFVDVADAGQSIKVLPLMPSAGELAWSAVILRGVVAPAGAGIFENAGAAGTIGLAAVTKFHVRITGSFLVGAGAGDFAIQWAPSVNDADDLTLLKLSSLTVTQA